jgi:hypothetical protein
MKYTPIIGHQLQQLRQKFSQRVVLPIHKVLPMADIEAALVAEQVIYRRCFFDPFITGRFYPRCSIPIVAVAKRSVGFGPTWPNRLRRRLRG